MTLKSRLVADEHPLIILPHPAAEIGLNTAIVLQQIYYWLTNEGIGRIIEGMRWLYNTYNKWQEQLSLLELSPIRRARAHHAGLEGVR